MKEIILSLWPEWWRKIVSGEKTIEIRKTMPNAPLPFKVYVYETRGGEQAIVGEFMVRKFHYNYSNYCGGKSCLTDKAIFNYGHGKAYGWEISDVQEYATPVTLQEFDFDRPPQSWCYVKSGDPHA